MIHVGIVIIALSRLVCRPFAPNIACLQIIDVSQTIYVRAIGGNKIIAARFGIERLLSHPYRTARKYGILDTAA